MFVALDDSIRDMGEVDFQSLEMYFDHLLHAHLRRAILLYLTPADIVRIGGAMQLGPVARATLAAISRRAADYGAALAQATRVFHLCSDASLGTAFQIAQSGVVRVRVGDFVRYRMRHTPQLFVENINSDARVVEFIFNAFCLSEGIPSNLVNIVPRHGGGSSLGDVLRVQPAGGMMGMVLTDRDSHPFDPAAPYRKGGTAEAAYEAAIAMNAIVRGQFGLSSLEPFFAFDLTGPRTIEGYIGPHLFNCYLENSGAAAVYFERALEAFPGFPNLTEQQMAIWFATNLKVGMHDPAELTIALTQGGFFPDQECIEAACLVSFPRNIISWLSENLVTGRFKRELHQAFRLDCDYLIYEVAVRDLASHIYDLFAGDIRMAIA